MDPSLSLSEFGSLYLGGKSVKTAKTTVLNEGIPYYIVNQKMYIKRSDAEKWREWKIVTPQPPSLKDRLTEITARVRARRRQHHGRRQASNRRNGRGG
jgi:hypothetical protein